MTVKIYLCSSIKGPRRRNGAVGYVLETETDYGVATLSDLEKVKDMTENQSETYALMKALGRLTKKCDLIICTDSPYVIGSMNRLEKWKADGWKKTNGEPISNLEEWKKIAEILNGITFWPILKDQHEYRYWLQNETKKMEDKEDV